VGGAGPGSSGRLVDVGHAEGELRREVVVLRRRIGKLAALLRLALALSHASDFSLVRTRVPEGPRKARLLRAIDQARAQMPLRGVLRFLGISAEACAGLATSGARVHARRPVVVSAHVAAAIDAGGGADHR
jgi:hypothetical protein